MTRRRTFSIDLPDDEGDATPAPARETPRRGPMASAVRETADSLRDRQEVEGEIRAENDALAHEHVRLRDQGLVLTPVPLALIDAGMLTRDRAPGEDPEMDSLKASIREIGLSNPIRVAKRGERYELIQGWRRLQAFRALHAQTGEARFATIPAGMTPEEDALETSYRRMVDENLVRKDISFAEMAELARAYAADPGTACTDVDAGVAALFRSAGYQKRSYIRAFAQLLELLGEHLKHPREVPRNLGLAVRRRLDAAPGELRDLITALRAAPERDASLELTILRGFVGEDEPQGRGPATSPADRPDAAVRPKAPRGAKTTFRVPRPNGEAKCTVSNGRLELSGETDFAALDRQRLERAVAAFYAALDD
jgi:ParB family chromosome partitioning protein